MSSASQLFLSGQSKSNLFFPILCLISLLFEVIPENIIKSLTSNKDLIMQTNKIQFYSYEIKRKLISNEETKSKKKYLFFLIFLIGIFTAFIHFISKKFILLQSFSYITTPPLLCIIATCGLHYLVFHFHLYLHQIVALVIMAIDTIIYYCDSYSSINENIKDLFGNWELGIFFEFFNFKCS